MNEAFGVSPDNCPRFLRQSDRMARRIADRDQRYCPLLVRPMVVEDVIVHDPQKHEANREDGTRCAMRYE